jgi:hypothetical protein
LEWHLERRFKGVSIKALFDQSVFVNAALSGVVMRGLMAARLTVNWTQKIGPAA